MEQNTAEKLFSEAAEIDPTLQLGQFSVNHIIKRRIPPTAYNRDTLFRHMADGRVSVFHDYPSPLRYSNLRNQNDHGEIVLRSYLDSGIINKIRVKTGQARTEKYFTVDQLVEKWRRQRTAMNITDFHFRGTDIEKSIDPQRISRFNLYPGCPELVAGLEMMTLVMSSVGGFSDSHSDDCDGSNHCFTGKKLWLAWDTHQGLATGLEDLDRVDVYDACKFDIDTWISLKSACWFIVEKGQTLFMPGHLTHKVVTLEPYLGVGSFYLALPNYLRTISKWMIHKPNWEALEHKGVRDELLPLVIQSLSRKISRLKRTSVKNQQTWGLDYLEYATNSWKNQFSQSQRKRILHSEFFQDSNAAAFRELAA